MLVGFVEEAGKICVTGELRSFNNKSGVGAKLVISLFAREIAFDEGEDMNYVSLEGTVCKPPTLRCTPLGREICDIMLAVNRAQTPAAAAARTSCPASAGAAARGSIPPSASGAASPSRAAYRAGRT